MTNIDIKRRTSKLDLGVLLCLIAATLLFTCEPVPDYCGKGQLLDDPACQFCFGDKTYSRCGGEKFNPLTEGCINDTEIGTMCRDSTIVPKGTPCGGYVVATDTVPKDGGGITRTPNTANYAAGDTVVLTATPNSNFDFIGWVGAAETNNRAVTIKMNGPSAVKPLVAMFKPIDEEGATTYRLITSAFPENGGNITRIPEANAGVYDTGTMVTVTATAKSGYTFSGWAGALTSALPTVRIEMDESKTLVAVFTPVKPVEYTLTVNVNPKEGGAVFVDKSAVSGTAPIDTGTTIEVRAVAADGYGFTGWSGASASKEAVVTIKMDGDKALTASFKKGATGGGSGKIEDSRDKQTYKTVVIGNQTWMAENLKYVPPNGGSWCYNNKLDSCARYGRMYDWYTALEVCPAGWHLPIREEWIELVNFVEGGNTGTAGTKLKSTSGWRVTGGAPNSNVGTDDFGFSAVSGGYRNAEGEFFYAGRGGHLWSATEKDNDRAYYLGMGYEFVVYDETSGKGNGLSVRCLLGPTPTPTTITPVTYTVVVFSNASMEYTNIGRYAAGATVQISAGTAPDGMQFLNWSTTSDGVIFADANNATTTFIMPENDVEVKALFGFESPKFYTLEIKVNPAVGGYVNYLPELDSYKHDTHVVVIAEAATGYEFTGWTGALNTTNNVEELVMDGNKTLTANFRALSNDGGGSYDDVEIGGLKWMKKNLNIATANSWCYGDADSNCVKYGRLYTWEAAKTVCPTGWRLPDTADWNRLAVSVGGTKSPNWSDDYWMDAGKALKSTSGWNNNGTDMYGFTALPGGARTNAGAVGGAGDDGYWWAATEESGGFAYITTIVSSADHLLVFYYNKSGGASVRCVADNN